MHNESVCSWGGVLKRGSLTESVGHLRCAAVSISTVIFISARTALPKALLSSKGFDLVEKFIVNIIFRPLTKESSSVWGKQGAIKQKTSQGAIKQET